MRRTGTSPFNVLEVTHLLLLAVYWRLPGSEAQWRCDVPSKPNNVVDEYTVIGWDGTNPYCASLDGKTCWADKSNNCQRKLRQLRVIQWHSTEVNRSLMQESCMRCVSGRHRSPACCMLAAVS